ncbi:MAG TPA: phosphate acyltransferase PlsX, partial [Gaiellales bacterium]|nr:phosphate acyltransferase PlsX [Gaiellales bacterium]
TACSLVREGRAQGAVSAGSTGAMMAASLLRMGRIRGVLRPGIGVFLPTPHHPCLLIDAGANVDCKPEHLLQFGVMGAMFVEDVLGIARPRVALLSIGEEPTKGDTRTVEAHALLRASDLEFAGNCEGRDALLGEVQVVVTDGFAGNVLLKGLEGAATALFGEIRRAAESGLRARVGGLLLRPALRETLRRSDPETYGGAYLLGVRGLSVVAHGNSSRRAIKNAVVLAARGAGGGVVERLEQRLAGSHLREAAATPTVSHVADRPMGDP